LRSPPQINSNPTFGFGIDRIYQYRLSDKRAGE
jgi:hypothetical protein